jgi:hypothetical protein
MSPLPDEVAPKPDVAAPDKPSTPADAGASPPVAEEGQAPSSPVAEESKAPATPASVQGVAPDFDDREPPPRNALLYTVFGLLCIGIALWLILAWSGYKEKYSQQTEGWHLGATKMLEITLIRDDKKNLACASDRTFGEVHCGYHLDGKPFGGKPEDDPHILQPFNTVKNELFLSAGLWQSPILVGTLPPERFTVVCNYHVIGVLKAVSLRWSPTGNFSPVDQSVAVGTLSDCVIPQ